MSNERSPNENHIERVSDSEELVDPNTAQQVQEEGQPSISTSQGSGQEEPVEDLARLDNRADEEELLSSSLSPRIQQEREEGVAEASKQVDQEQQVTDLDEAKRQQEQQEQQIAPTMSPEQVLLLQLLRRAKRQQELVIEVQKNLKSLITIQKGMEKTTDQVKQLQSVVKDSQKQIIQLQRQISAIERAQEKEFAKLRTQKRGGAAIPVSGKVAKNRKRKKTR
jgi:hypothetical protein